MTASERIRQARQRAQTTSEMRTYIVTVQSIATGKGRQLVTTLADLAGELDLLRAETGDQTWGVERVV